jgi:hypothetical protein
MNKDETEIHDDPGTYCMSRLAGRMARMCRALKPNLALNNCLTEMKLVGLKIDEIGWKALGSGLSKNRTI